MIGGLVARTAAAQTAMADLRNAQGEAVGSATLMEGPQGVRILLQVAKLPAGSHGIHIHAAGACDPPSFVSAGGHFNPGAK